MWLNEDKFPKDFTCPPANAYQYTDILYKVSTSIDERDSYLRKTFIETKDNFNNQARLCQACGHSVYTSADDIINTLNRSGKTNKGLSKKWKHIYSFKPGIKGKVLDTPSKNSKNHHTYWHHGNNAIIFCYVDKL